jgi:hypothetical protein
MSLPPSSTETGPAPEEVLRAASEALSSHNYRQAEGLLQQSMAANGPLEAQRLLLLSKVRYYLGDLPGYRQLAVEAARLEQNFATLHNLGRSLPPRQAVLALAEAAALAATPREISQAAIGMARTLGRLGRVKEALPHASLALLHQPDPLYQLDWVALALLADDYIPLETLIDRVTPLLDHPVKAVQMEALNRMATLRLAQQQYPRAESVFEALLPLLSPNQLVFHAPVGLAIYRALGKEELAFRLAQAAQLPAQLSPLHQGMALLVLGMAYFPQPQAVAPLQKARDLLREESPIEYLKATLYLASLNTSPPSPETLELLQQWSNRSQVFLPALTASKPGPNLRLEALGRPQLVGSNGRLPLRPRHLEALVLLQAHPKGLNSEEFCELLYGKHNPRALKVELQRLRDLLQGGLTSRPWRLEVPIDSDWQELQTHLRAGRLGQAIQLYRGSLLPHSHAPGIEELRHALEEDLRTTVLVGGSPEQILALAERFPDDLTVWESLLEHLSRQDARYPAVIARIRRLKSDYKRRQ